MQTFFLAPTRQNVGLTSVALGVVRALQRQGLRVGFVKPVAQDGNNSERSIHFARTICHIDAPTAMSMTKVAGLVTANESDELLEEIVGLCIRAGDGMDVLIVEGLHTDPSYPFTTRLNADIARSLHAELVLVANAQTHEVFDELHLNARGFENSGVHVAGVIFNKASHSFNANHAHMPKALPVWGVVRFDQALTAPRTVDVARCLNAEILVKGEIEHRRVLDTVVAARSAAELLDRLKAGALVISSGDRDDVMLATALAASKGVQLAGLLLTHSSTMDPRLFAWASSAFQSGLPIMRTHTDSFGTATAISQVPNAVAADDTERMNDVLDVIAEQIDPGALTAGMRLPTSAHLSPPAFRHQLIQKARLHKKRIVLPEGDEPRTVRAAAICEEKGIARCLLLGKREAIAAVANAQGIQLPPSLQIVDPDSIREDYVAHMVELRKAKGLTEGQAREQLMDNVVLGTVMVAIGEVDGLVSGAVHTTANTVRPALQLIKPAPSSTIVSSVLFMLMPDQVLVYGDCAINPDPNAEQLAEIALQSADSARTFGIEPKVAMISYSTGSSGSGEDVEKVRRATEIARAKRPDLIIDGPMQYDAASVKEVGAQKAPGSLVAGQATVFVFPDLNTGNTTYKAVQRSANVLSVGPMLQGLRKPVNDLSRGALVDDIVFTIALTAIQAHAMKEAS